MKATMQKVPQRQGWSWRYKKLLDDKKTIEWHAHQEYELVLHRHFQGNALIGHNQEQVIHNDLTLIGPDTPHAVESVSVDLNQQCETHMFWFKREWISNMMYSCVELRRLSSILQLAENGVHFSSKTAEKIYSHLENFEQLCSIGQLAVLIQVFAELCADKSVLTLQERSATAHKFTRGNSDKIDKVCQYISLHFQGEITLSALANTMHVSENTIHRWFTQCFSESFSEYLKKVRLNHAAELLVSTSLPINLVAEKSGYRNRSNFNRQFKQYKKLPPTQYRAKLSLRKK